MQATALILVIVALAVCLAPSVTADTSFSFAVPAQMGPDVQIRNATWVLAAFDGGEAAIRLVTDSPSLQQNITEYVLGRGDAAVAKSDGARVPVSDDARVGAFDASLAKRDGGRASLFATGARLDIDVQQMAAEVIVSGPGDCADRLVGDDEGDHYLDARYADLCPAVAGPVLVLRPSQPAARATMKGQGLQAVEWHNLGASCATSSCPAGSQRDVRTSQGPLWNLTAGSYGFTHLELAGNNSLQGDAVPRMIAVGGPDLELAVQGWLRMPNAAGGEACASCIQDGATVTTTGAISLRHLRASDQGRLRGVLGGDLADARLDEAHIDPARLLGNVPVAAVAAAAAAGVVLLVKVLFSALFTRLSGEEALEHPNRRLLVDRIAKEPGINFRGLVRASGIAAGTVRHHLTILVRAGIVTEQGLGSTRRFFAGRATDGWEHQVLLREPGMRQIHDWVAANPGATQLEVLDAMAEAGVSRSTTQHRLERMCERGAVEARWQGRFKRYWPRNAAPAGPSPRVAAPGSGLNAAG